MLIQRGAQLVVAAQRKHHSIAEGSKTLTGLLQRFRVAVNAQDSECRKRAEEHFGVPTEPESGVHEKGRVPLERGREKLQCSRCEYGDVRVGPNHRFTRWPWSLIPFRVMTWDRGR